MRIEDIHLNESSVAFLIEETMLKSGDDETDKFEVVDGNDILWYFNKSKLEEHHGSIKYLVERLSNTYIRSANHFDYRLGVFSNFGIWTTDYNYVGWLFAAGAALGYFRCVVKGSERDGENSNNPIMKYTPKSDAIHFNITRDFAFCHSKYHLYGVPIYSRCIIIGLDMHAGYSIKLLDVDKEITCLSDEDIIPYSYVEEMLDEYDKHNLWQYDKNGDLLCPHCGKTVESIYTMKFKFCPYCGKSVWMKFTKEGRG